MYKITPSWESCVPDPCSDIRTCDFYLQCFAKQKQSIKFVGKWQLYKTSIAFCFHLCHCPGFGHMTVPSSYTEMREDSIFNWTYWTPTKNWDWGTKEEEAEWVPAVIWRCLPQDVRGERANPNVKHPLIQNWPSHVSHTWNITPQPFESTECLRSKSVHSQKQTGLSFIF